MTEAKEMKGQGKHLVILCWKHSWLQLQLSLGEMEVFNKLAWIFQRDLSLAKSGGLQMARGADIPPASNRPALLRVICFPLTHWGRTQVISDGEFS